MAYFNNDEENNKNVQGMNSQKPEEAGAEGSNTQLSSGVSNASSGPIHTGSQASAVAPKATTSGMTGFQTYQKANQGAGTSNLNSAASSNVANQAQNAKTGINQASQTFGNKVDAGSLANRDKAVDDVKAVVEQARNITAPTPAAPAATPAETSTPEASTATASAPDPLAGVENKSRFQEVINAKYQGPESLRQSGEYNKVSGKVDQAQTAIDQTKTAQGREELLKDIFSKHANYTQGLNKLDAGLLNASQGGVAQLQETAKAQGDLGGQLDQAQIASANLAKNRTQEIEDIKNQAKGAFTEGLTAERAETEERLASVIKDWEKLPNYFKDVIRNKVSTNKKIQESAIADYKKNNPFSPEITKSFTDAEAKYNAALSAYEKSKVLTGSQTGAQMRYVDGPQSGPAKEAMLQARDEYVKQRDNFTNAKNKWEAGLENIKNNFNSNAIALNAQEAAILGIQNGEGLYNLGTDAIKVGKHEKDRLISKDEQARQAALSALAELDLANSLDRNLLYADASKAGTQSALDALDIEGIRRGLNEAEGDFQNRAKNTTITGEGHKKVSRGNAFSKKTKHYYANVSGNAKKLLEGAGYDFNNEKGDYTQDVANAEQMLKMAYDKANFDRNNADKEDNDKVIGSTLQGGATGAGVGATIGSAVPGLGTAMGGLVGGALGAAAGTTIGSGSVDPFQQYSDLAVGFGGPVGAAGKAFQDGRKVLGNVARTALGNNFIGKGIGGAIGGISSSDMKKFGDAIAKEGAIKDFNKKYEQFLEKQGFDNRFQVSNNEAVKQRVNALEQLLASLDKTNT